MYGAKHEGKGAVRVLEPAMVTASVAAAELEAELAAALEHDEFELHYQPIVDLKTEVPVGMEALIRWRHPERGLLSPGEFLPAAEQAGLMVPAAGSDLGRRTIEPPR